MRDSPNLCLTGNVPMSERVGSICGGAILAKPRLEDCGEIVGDLGLVSGAFSYRDRLQGRNTHSPDRILYVIC